MLSLIVEMTFGEGLISSRARRTAAMNDAAINNAFLDFSSLTASDIIGEEEAKHNLYGESSSD
jgi:hypothetical protein